MAVIETPEERAARLGLGSESADQRAARLGLDAAPTGHNGVPFVDAKPDEPSYLQQAAGGVAALLRSVPGGEAAQAGVRSVVRGQPYAQAREDIRDAEATANPWVRNLNSLAGGGIAAAALPGGAVRQGASFGALNALGDSDPTKNLKTRVDKAGAEMVVGGAAGGLFGAGRAIKNAPPGTGRAIASEIPVVGRFVRAGNKVQALRDAETAALRPRVRLGEASAPKTPKAAGLQSPFESASEHQGPTGVVNAIKAQRPPTSTGVVDAVKKSRPQAHRTQAQFDNFAEQMRQRNAKPSVVDAFSREAEAADNARGTNILEPDDYSEALRRSIKLAPRRP